MQNIFEATIIVSRTAHTISAFSGFLNESDIDRFNAFFRKALLTETVTLKILLKFRS